MNYTYQKKSYQKKSPFVNQLSYSTSTSKPVYNESKQLCRLLLEVIEMLSSVSKLEQEYT